MTSLGSGVLEFKREVKIPVPWGHLSAKEWGQEDGLPILAIHGWTDNAGSFDKLAPLLPPHVRLVCLDLCGHGLSSHFPPGKFVMYHDYVYQVKLVFDYFKWKKAVIIGHSLGGLIALLFTSMFPELVKKIITLERIRDIRWSKPYNLVHRLRNSMDKFQSVSAKLDQGSPPITYAQARSRMIEKYNGSIDEKDADVLLVRGLKKRSGEDEWEFTRDPRCNIELILFFHLTLEQMKAVARAITCPHLMIIAKSNFFQYSQPQIELLDISRNSSEDFRYVEVEGRHHVHLSNPEVVAPHIYNFLLPFKSTL